MAHVLRMPAVLAGATEAVLLAWTVAEGDDFAEGDVLAEIETDKALVELAAEESATLGRTLVLDGEKVTVGDPIAVLMSAGDSDDDIAAALATIGTDAPPTDEDGPVETALDQPLAEPTQPDEPAEGAKPTSEVHPLGERVFMSPLVRRLAREHRIDPVALRGTGPRGRIVRRDLEAHLAQLTQHLSAAPEALATASTASTAASFEDVPHTGMRRAIARRLTESKATIPHFYVSAELRVDRLVALRAEINASGGVRVSINDLLIKAIGAAFIRVPEANVIWTDDALRHFTSVDVAVAVSTDKGLVTPVVRDVASTSIGTLSATVSELVAKARAGRLQQHQLEGGSFSISNLGMFGTREFTAILNPPHSGILAVGAVRDGVVVDDGTVRSAQVMTVVLSVDHRAVDGALAARWLAAFSEIVESPLTIMV